MHHQDPLYMLQTKESCMQGYIPYNASNCQGNNSPDGKSSCHNMMPVGESSAGIIPIINDKLEARTTLTSSLEPMAHLDKSQVISSAKRKADDLQHDNQMFHSKAKKQLTSIKQNDHAAPDAHALTTKVEMDEEDEGMDLEPRKWKGKARKASTWHIKSSQAQMLGEMRVYGRHQQFAERVSSRDPDVKREMSSLLGSLEDYRAKHNVALQYPVLPPDYNYNLEHTKKEATSSVDLARKSDLVRTTPSRRPNGAFVDSKANIRITDSDSQSTAEPATQQSGRQTPADLTSLAAEYVNDYSFDDLAHIAREYYSLRVIPSTEEVEHALQREVGTQWYQWDPPKKGSYLNLLAPGRAWQTYTHESLALAIAHEDMVSGVYDDVALTSDAKARMKDSERGGDAPEDDDEADNSSIDKPDVDEIKEC